jgi:hypothetical protein
MSDERHSKLMYALCCYHPNRIQTKVVQLKLDYEAAATVSHRAIG